MCENYLILITFACLIFFSHICTHTQPLMLNTLGVRSAVGEANRRKLSFRNVSNVVVQLLHTIKPYSVPAPFSHLAVPTGSGFSNESAGIGTQDNKTRQVKTLDDFLLIFINENNWNDFYFDMI